MYRAALGRRIRPSPVPIEFGEASPSNGIGCRLLAASARLAKAVACGDWALGWESALLIRCPHSYAKEGNCVHCGVECWIDNQLDIRSNR